MISLPHDFRVASSKLLETFHVNLILQQLVNKLNEAITPHFFFFGNKLHVKIFAFAPRSTVNLKDFTSSPITSSAAVVFLAVEVTKLLGVNYIARKRSWETKKVCLYSAKDKHFELGKKYFFLCCHDDNNDDETSFQALSKATRGCKWRRKEEKLSYEALID